MGRPGGFGDPVQRCRGKRRACRAYSHSASSQVGTPSSAFTTGDAGDGASGLAGGETQTSNRFDPRRRAAIPASRGTRARCTRGVRSRWSFGALPMAPGGRMADASAHRAPGCKSITGSSAEGRPGGRPWCLLVKTRQSLGPTRRSRPWPRPRRNDRRRVGSRSRSWRAPCNVSVRRAGRPTGLVTTGPDAPPRAPAHHVSTRPRRVRSRPFRGTPDAASTGGPS
jgi:hypothetical protein